MDKSKWLTKAIHVYSVHFTEDDFDERQKVKRHFLSGELKYLLN